MNRLIATGRYTAGTNKGKHMSRLKFKYVRIQGKELAPNTLQGKGVFSMCWKLVQKKITAPLPIYRGQEIGIHIL